MEKKIQTIYDIIKKYDKIELTDRETQLGCDEINIIVDTLKDAINTLKTYATKTELQNAQKTLGDSIAENTTNIGANTSLINDLQSSVLAVTEIANNAIKSVKGGTATDSFITIKANTTAAKAVTVTATAKTIAVNEADDNHDGLTTAKYVKDYVLATVAAETSVAIEPLLAKINANTKALSKLGETYLTAIAASETEYDEWDAIVAAAN